MKTTYVDPLIPLGETTGAALTRLRANIGTLTGLISDTVRHGGLHLAGMLTHSRETKIAEARALISSQP